MMNLGVELDRAHPHQRQMLHSRLQVSEIGIVRKIQQNISPFGRKLSHQIREGGLVTDEDAEMLAAGIEHLDVSAGSEVPRFLADPVHKCE